MSLRTLLAATVAAAGCSGPAGPVPVPVAGRVLLDGRPVAGAVVRFVADESAPPLTHPPNGVTDADGRFRLSYAGREDGAPPGRYRVTVVLPAPDAEGTRSGRNLLPDRYADPARSGLTAAVGAGPSDLPAFDLRGR